MMLNTKIIQNSEHTTIQNKMITYVISLNQPNKLIQNLKYHSLDPILFPGILGKQCPQHIINKHFSPFYRYFGPKSSIGCALSHLNVWKTFLKTDKSYAIIFEDDIILDNIEFNLLNTISFYINKTPQDFDILYLGSFGSDNTPNFFTIIMSLLNMCSTHKDTNHYIKQPQVALGLHSYIISKTGAKKLIQHLDNNIHHHIDYCIQNLYSQGILNNYITKPRLLYQSSTDSNISNNVSNTHPIIINKILSDFYVDKHVKASYITTLSIIRLGNVNITISSLILFILTLYFLISKKNVNLLIVFLILLSLPDMGLYQPIPV